jgi:hypothetical protein
VDAAKYLADVVAKNPATTWTAVINGPFLDWVRDKEILLFVLLGD